MAPAIAERALRDRRRGLLGWALGIAAYVGLQLSVYPSVQDSDLQRAVRSYPKELKAFFGGAQAFDVSTGAGYLNIELFSLIVPALLAIVAIGYGASTLAGEQESGTLDLVLASPVTRSRVVLEKVVGLVATVLLLAIVVGVMVLLVGAFVGLDVGAGRVAVACLGAALVGILFGVLAMLAGALSGSRAVAIGVATAVFAASYLIQGLSGLVSWLEPARFASPLYHASGTHPLRNGLPVGNDALLAGVCAALVALTVVVFDRRDLAR